jgi:hypothetical protein
LTLGLSAGVGNVPAVKTVRKEPEPGNTNL